MEVFLNANPELEEGRDTLTAPIPGARFDSCYEVLLAILAKMGGDATRRYDSEYEVELAILEVAGQGGGGMTPEEVRALVLEIAYSKDEIDEELANYLDKRLTLGHYGFESGDNGKVRAAIFTPSQVDNFTSDDQHNFVSAGTMKQYVEREVGDINTALEIIIDGVEHTTSLN